MYLVFDIGGTKIRLGTSIDGATLKDTKIIPTLEDFDQSMISIKNALSDIAYGERIQMAAGGVRALSLDKKTLANRPHLPLWVDEPLYETLQEMIGAPLYLENDADLAGVGESTRGAGTGYKVVAYLTISTGVGGARIVDRKIDANALGFEPGYQIIEEGKFLGDFISGKALEDIYNKKGEDIDDPQVWDKVANYLSIGLNNITVMWSPDIIILGGSVTNSIPLDKVEEYLKEKVKIFSITPKIVKAQLGDEAGLYGALTLLQDKAQ